MDKQRDTNLDILKIMASIAVIGLHTVMQELSIFNSTLYYLCGFAVPIFFMVNGYLLLPRKEISAKYVFRKICTILKVVVLWNVGVFFAFLLFKGELINLPETIAKSLVQKGFLWQFWFLGALIILYVSLPMIHAIFRKSKRLHFFCWIALCMICNATEIASVVSGRPVQKEVLQTFRLWTWFCYFIGGGYMQYLVPAIAAKLSKRRHGIILIVLTSIVLIWQNCAARYFIHDFHAEYFYDGLLTMLWNICIFSYMKRIQIKPSWVKSLSKASALTMGCYIIHPIFIRIGNQFLLIDDPAIAVLWWALITGISFFAAWVMLKTKYVRALIKL